MIIHSLILHEFMVHNVLDNSGNNARKFNLQCFCINMTESKEISVVLHDMRFPFQVKNLKGKHYGISLY